MFRLHYWNKEKEYGLLKEYYVIVINMYENLVQSRGVCREEYMGLRRT